MTQIQTFNAKLFAWAPINPSTCWGLVAAILALGHFLLAYLTKSHTYPIASMAQVTLVFLAGWAPIFVANKLKEIEPAYDFMIAMPSQDLQKWLSSQYSMIFDPKFVFGWGIALPVITLQAQLAMLEAHKGSMVLRIYDSFLGFAALYLCCATLMIYPRILISWHHVKSLPMRSVAILSQSKCIGLLSVAATKFSLIVTIAFSLMMVVLFTGPTRFGVADYIYAGIGSSVCLICFIIPQWILHKLLREMKNRLRDDFDGRLDAITRSLSVIRDHLSSENAKTLSELLLVHDRIESIREWPVSLQSLTGLLTSELLT